MGLVRQVPCAVLQGWTAEFLPECAPLLLTALLCSALSLLWETFVQSSFSGKDGVGVVFVFFFSLRHNRKQWLIVFS